MKHVLTPIALVFAGLHLSASADTCSAVKGEKGGKAYHCSPVITFPKGNLAAVKPPRSAPEKVGDLTDDHHSVALAPAAAPAPAPAASPGNPQYFLTDAKGVRRLMIQSAVDSLKATGVINPDGSLTPRAIQSGVSVVGLHLQPAGSVASGSTGPRGSVTAPQNVAPPALTASQTQLSYFLTDAKGTRLLMTQGAVDSLKATGVINPDGSLTPRAIQSGVSVVGLNLQPAGSPRTPDDPLRPSLTAPPTGSGPTATAPDGSTRLPQPVASGSPGSGPTVSTGSVVAPQNVATRLPVVITTSSIAPSPIQQTQHVLAPHGDTSTQPVTSGRVVNEPAYSLEFIEPGLQNRKVKVYRTNDAAEQVYKDTIPLDKGGFQIVIVGTRNPEYVR